MKPFPTVQMTDDTVLKTYATFPVSINVSREPTEIVSLLGLPRTRLLVHMTVLTLDVDDPIEFEFLGAGPDFS